MIGKCSSFGGRFDCGMKNDTGLALYEPAEADLRPDIFLPADAGNPTQPTWKRLKTHFPYIALRYDHTINRRQLQNTPYRITNLKTSQWAVAYLVDWGPAESTGRLIDMSPGLISCLRLNTDDDVGVAEMTPLC